MPAGLLLPVQSVRVHPGRRLAVTLRVLPVVVCVAVLGPVTLGQAVELQGRQHTLTYAGLPRGLQAADVTGDGQLDAVAVVEEGTGGRRQLIVLDGVQLVANPGYRGRVLDVPPHAACFGVCASVGGGLILVGGRRVSRLDLQGQEHLIVELDEPGPPIEPGDLPWVELCPGGQLVVPTLTGYRRVEEGQARPLAPLPHRSYLTSGRGFRGPRARRDFALMATMLHPRLFAGEVDGDGQPDLVATIEEELALYLRDRVVQRSLDARALEARQQREGMVDIQLVELTGDGLLDAVATFQRGGSGDLRTSWSVFPGPLVDRARVRLSGGDRLGLAAPLLRVDVDLDGVEEILEPHAETGLVAMGRALVTGHLAIAYRLHRFVGGHQESPPFTLEHDIDFGRTTNLAGQPPLLGADFDGDRRVDLVHLGRARQVEIYLGRNGATPFSSTAALTLQVPTTERAVTLRRADHGPPALLFLDEQAAQAQLTILTVSR